MLTLLFLPAMQVKIPVAEACVPSEPVEVQEITGSEKQQITNILLSSSKFSTAVEWLKTKNIETDTSLEAIQVLKINSSRFSGYIAKIPQKIDTIPRDIGEIRIGGIFVVLDESKEISSVMGLFLKPTVNTKSTILEALTINNKESQIIYVLITQGTIYKLVKPYKNDNIKVSVQQTPEIEVMTTCEDLGSQPCSGPGGSCPYGYYCHEVCTKMDWWCVVWHCGLRCALAIGSCIAALLEVFDIAEWIFCIGSYVDCLFCMDEHHCCVELLWCCGKLPERG